MSISDKYLVSWLDRIDILHQHASEPVPYAPTSTRVSRSGSERPREETEELPLSRRQLESSTSLSTGRSNISNVCSEGSLQETRVEELNARPSIRTSLLYYVTGKKRWSIRSYNSSVDILLTIIKRRWSLHNASSPSTVWLQFSSANHQQVVSIMHTAASLKALLPFDFVNTSGHSTRSFYTCLLSVGYSP